MGLVAVIGLVAINGNLLQMAINGLNILNSFVMTAVPLFVFMGAIFVESGITNSLFRGVNAWVGRLPGGLATSVVGACAVFAAISGSSMATAAALGTISLPEMEKYHYDPRLAVGAVAAGGTLGILIPPSMNLIVYGVWTETSVVDLFAAGLIPGLILAVLFEIVIIVMVMFNPGLAPKTAGTSWGEKLKLTAGIAPWILTIVLVLGVIFAGIMTPTEAAALGGFIAIILAMAYRRMSFKILRNAALMAVRISAMLGLLIAGAMGVVFVLNYIKIPGLLIALFSGFGTYSILAFIALLYALLGCFIGPISIMLLTLPFLIPIIGDIGYERIWFGVYVIILSEMAMLTPPIGDNLFVIQTIAPQHSFLTIVKGVAPFLIPLVIILVILAVWPEVALWLPNMLRMLR